MKLFKNELCIIVFFPSPLFLFYSVLFQIVTFHPFIICFPNSLLFLFFVLFFSILFRLFSQALESEMTVSRNAHLTDLQSMKQHYTNLSETQRSKQEEEKTILINDIEKRNSFSEDNYKKQLKDALHREENHARGRNYFIPFES